MLSKIKTKVASLASKCKVHANKIAGAITGVAVGACASVSAFAAETSSGTGITINFEPSQMFTYSNVIIDCLMPVVYITAGLSLGFTVIYALRGAFSSRM